MSQSMSESNNNSTDDAQNTPTREVAKRVSARELAESTYSFKESDEDRAAQYTLFPTGGRANRIAIVGTLTDSDVRTTDDGKELVSGRVNDGDMDFLVNAPPFEPGAVADMKKLSPPCYVTIVGKLDHREYQGEHYVNVRIESVQEVSEADRDRWLMEMAEQTLDRIEAMNAAAAGGESTPDIQRAQEQYDVDITEILNGLRSSFDSVFSVSPDVPEEMQD